MERPPKRMTLFWMKKSADFLPQNRKEVKHENAEIPTGRNK